MGNNTDPAIAIMLYGAALLLVVLAVAHSWLGERYLLQRLFRNTDALPKLLGGTSFTKNTLRMAWHLTTVMAVAFALLLVQIARHATAAEMVFLIGVALLLAGLLPLVITRARHLSWLALFVAAGLCLGWAAQQ